MKQAALITCHNIKNYGSVFQTYATTVVFKGFGYDVTVIDYQRPGTDKEGFRKRTLQESHMAKKPVIKYVFPYVLKVSFQKMERVFSDFLRKYVATTAKTYLTEEELVQDCPGADLYISGSDQIWNSDINGRIERPYYLSFLQDDKMRISFASSFGKTQLHDGEKEETRTLLSKYQWLSTRERSGTEIIHGLGLDADTVLDPTLWLSKEQWERLAEPVRAPKRYVLVYQLHNNKAMDQYIKQMEKTCHLPCLRVDLFYHYMVKSGRHIVCPTPGQLISLIKNAEYVISDSFHMTVFSILFNKKFISIYSENSFNDRIASILKLLDLEDRHLESYADFGIWKKEIDFDKVNRCLEEQKRRMRTLLGRQLQIIEESPAGCASVI